jgi:predicted Zn-dependent protease
MKPKKVIIILISFFLAGTIFSCAIVSGVVQAAGTAGFIDKNTVDSTVKAINASSKAIDSAAEEITPQQEYYIGRAVAANILASYKLYTKNRKLTAYLNNICAAITINSMRPNIYNGYHVALLDSNEINAFATSGGHIFVTRGLVNAAKSEDALAGVIAHEVAHIQLRHSINAIKSSRFTQAFLVTGTSAASVATGMDAKQLTALMNESVGDIVQTLVNSGYSQAQEFEADNTAMLLMSYAGYNPSGLIEMLKSLSTVQKAGVGLGKTHPSPAQRIKNAEITILLYGNVKNTNVKRKARFASAVK